MPHNLSFCVTHIVPLNAFFILNKGIPIDINGRMSEARAHMIHI